MKVLSEYGKIFHPNHHLLIATKRYLMYTLPLGLDLRIRLAKDILKVYDVILPGLTKERGLTLFEIHGNFLKIHFFGEKDGIEKKCDDLYFSKLSFCHKKGIARAHHN